MIVSRSRTMHPQSPPLTIGRTVLKESDDLDILWVTFDSKMTFEKHLHSVSRAASQRLGILKSWRVFLDRLLLGRFLGGFVLPVLEYCCAVWFSVTIHTLNYWRVVSGARFLTGCVCVWHCSSPICGRLYMLYMIRCNPIHPLYGALPVMYMPVRVTRAALIAHRYIYAPPRRRTSQYCRTFISLSVSLWNDLAFKQFMKYSGVLPTQFAHRKGFGTCDALPHMSHTVQVHWSVGRKSGLCRSTALQLLTGLTTREFPSNSALWELEVQCSLFSHSFFPIGHSTSWWIIVGAIWLTWRREYLDPGIFWGADVVPLIHLGVFFHTREQAVWLRWIAIWRGHYRFYIFFIFAF